MIKQKNRKKCPEFVYFCRPNHSLETMNVYVTNLLRQGLHLIACCTIGLLGLQPLGAQTHYVFRRLNVADGLASNYVNKLAQDRTGCIWAATEGGLSRFDGSRMQTFTAANSDLPSDEINTVLADTLRGTLWIGTKRNGCVVMDEARQTMTLFTTDNGLVTNDVTGLSHAADGDVWLTHYHLGVEHYRPENGTFTPYTTENIEGLKGTFWCAVEDKNGTLYVGSNEHGLYLIDLKSRTCRNFRHRPDEPSSLPGDQVKTVFIDRNDNVWVGTNRGLALYHPQRGDFTRFLTDTFADNSLLGNQVNDIGQSTDGTLWVCTHMGGVSTLNLNNNTFRKPEEAAHRQHLPQRPAPGKGADDSCRHAFLSCRPRHARGRSG